MNITRDLQIALYAWTAAIANARAEYAAHPTAACRGVDYRGDDRTPCDDLAADGDTHCRRHRRELNKKAATMRARKASK